ncbi:MAG: ABC transporter substrate-binding protein [Spirochaetes bacterium]|nr:ABC transporter substrate-binding protein [Spirochaetota bacterium]
MRAFMCMLLVVAVALSGCTGAAKVDTIKIGWFGPQTGDTALWGQAEFNTVQMIVDEYNAKGGLKVGSKTYKLDVVGYDDKGDSTEAVNVAKRLTSQDKVVAIVGAQGSGEAIPVAPIMNEAKIPLVASTATNPKVTVTESGAVNAYMFRACFTDPYQGAVAATYAYNKLGKRKAAIFMTVDDAYSAGLSEFFKKSFTKLGGKIVAEVSFTAGEKDFRAPLTKIKASNPDVIFSPNYYTDVSLSAKQARELGITSVMLGGDGWPSENLISLAGTALEGCFFVNHLDFSDPSVADFKNAYKAKFKKNAELNSYMVRDALAMVIDAIQRAGTIDSVAIMKALETTDIQGITGHIKIGPTHDPVGKDAAIIKIVGTEMVFQEKIQAQP